MTFDEALQNPAYAHFRESIRLLESADDEELVGKKLLLVRKSIIREEMAKIRRRKRKMSLRATMLHLFKDLPDTISPASFLELTTFAIAEWEITFQTQAEFIEKV